MKSRDEIKGEREACFMMIANGLYWLGLTPDEAGAIIVRIHNILKDKQ